MLPPTHGSEGVKNSEATDYRGFARIKTNDLSVPIRVHPWLGSISSRLLAPWAKLCRSSELVSKGGPQTCALL